MKKILLALAITLLVLQVVLADPGSKKCTDPDIICDMGTVSQTAAIASGSGSAPEIKFVWVLPDEDSTETGTQLNPKLSKERNDIYACIVVRDAQSREDIQDVFVKVYHPDDTGLILPCVLADNDPDKDGLFESMVCDQSGFGFPWNKDTLFKYQVHATKLDRISDRTTIEECKGDALDAGLITQEQYDDIDYEIFSQPDADMYRVYLPMLYHQPAGWYRVDAYAVDTQGNVATPKTATFEWVSTVAIEIDFFAGLDYGVLTKSVYAWIQGDYTMSDGDGEPTIKNEGNERVALAVSSTPLTGSMYQKNITDFDVKWDPEEDGIVTPGYGTKYFTSKDDPVDLGCTNGDETPLELCQTEKIDFSVHAATDLPQDTYTGTMTIEATAFTSCGP